MSEYDDRSDAELLDTAARNPSAFGALYDRHAAGIYRWARSTGLSDADALDLVSELFARAWISRKRFRDPGDGDAAPWLFGIARNLVASHRRRGSIEARARTRLRMPLADDFTTDGIDARLDAVARGPALERALDALPAAQRSAVRLRVVDGLDYPAIARQLSCTETTARKWVSVGLRVARVRMETTQ
jgi:RNA polymerase sigma-70 factor (ECF subfamily)